MTSSPATMALALYASIKESPKSFFEAVERSNVDRALAVVLDGVSWTAGIVSNKGISDTVGLVVVSDEGETI